MGIAQTSDLLQVDIRLLTEMSALVIHAVVPLVHM